MTLIELVVVVAILGVIAATVVLALPRATAVDADDPGPKLTELRRKALHSGLPQPLRLTMRGALHEIVALPDGSMIADSGVVIDRLTARWKSAR